MECSTHKVVDEVGRAETHRTNMHFNFFILHLKNWSQHSWLFTSLVSAVIPKFVLFLCRMSSTSVSFVFMSTVAELHPVYDEFRPQPVNKPFRLI